MVSIPFPLPVSLFSRDLLRVCSDALEDAWTFLGPERERLVVSSEVARLSLAHGIVIAVTLGVRDQRRLAKAALQHLEHDTSRTLPQLQPLGSETSAKWQAAERYRYRAEEVRAAMSEVTDLACRDALAAITADYERMARAAERIEISRAALNGGPRPRA